MKTTIHFLLILSFLLSNNTSIFAQTDLEKEGLKGKIKTISTTVYRSTMDGDNIKLLGVSQLQKSSFNEAGYMISTEYQINSLSMGEGPQRKIIYDLDKDNNVLKETAYKDDKEGMSTQYVYKKGRLIEAKYYQGGDEYLGTQYFSYDAKGNKLRSNSTDPEGNSLQKLEFTYTKDNKLASSKKSKGEELVRYTKYEYPNKKEKKTIYINTENETISSYSIDTYDEHENVLKSIDYSPDGKVKRKHSNEYNKDGEITLRQIFNAEGKEEKYNYMRYQYLHDKKGNWIQKVEFLHNGNSLDATKREIEYYQ